MVSGCAVQIRSIGMRWHPVKSRTERYLRPGQDTPSQMFVLGSFSPYGISSQTFPPKPALDRHGRKCEYVWPRAFLTCLITFPGGRVVRDTIPAIEPPTDMATHPASSTYCKHGDLQVYNRPLSPFAAGIQAQSLKGRISP